MSASTSIILIVTASAFWTASLLANRLLKFPRLSESSGNYRVSKIRRNVRRSAFFVGMVCLWLTFTPYSLNVRSVSEPTKDVAFVLDVSRSMDAVDADEDSSRLDRAKTLIAGIVEKHPQNRYSLTVFAWDAYEAVPKTSDKTAFVALLSGISSKYSNSVGTDYFKVGKHLDDRYGKWTDDAKSKPTTLAVILTDGWDAEDTPNLANLRSVLQHTKNSLETLTVTYGSPEGAQVPLWKDFMGWTVYQTDKSWNPVVSKSNRETARRIADATDGRETDEKNAESAFSDALESAETPDGEGRSQSETPVSPFHFISLLAFVAAFTIPDKIPAWSKKRSLPAS